MMNPIHNSKFGWVLAMVAGVMFHTGLFISPAGADKMHDARDGGKSISASGQVPLLDGLYAIDFPVTTSHAKAKAYFNQGLVLTYGFDHADAEVSFKEALKYDPDMAMAYWGIAYVLGPNINAPMFPQNVERAYQMVRKAVALEAKATPKERALIRALSARYDPKPSDDRTSLDKAYADAMADVYGKFPNDPDIAVLYAEALMDLHPWDYWTADDRARPWTTKVRAVLEKAVGDHPRHPHVHHLYIHLMENSPTPEVAVPNADIILDLVPASGHLVHMAGHAYYAAGFYNDCSLSNERALGVDRMLLDAFDTKGLYQLGYMPHVMHFLLASYMMEGRSANALQASRALAKSVDQKMMRAPGFESLQHYFLAPYYTMVRFGKWDEILKEPFPDADLLYPQGMLRYARGMAYVAKGQPEQAREELEALDKLRELPELAPLRIWDINKVTDILAIASDVLNGRIATYQGDFDSAVAYLEAGVSKELNLLFDEPPPWYFPVREALGQVLLMAGDLDKANAVFRKDLLKNSENPYSLYGLTVTLEKQGDAILALETRKRFRKAWSRADIQMPGSASPLLTASGK